MRMALVAGLLLALGACGMKPIPYPTPEADMPDRPGLFTGPTGDVVLFKR